MQPPAPWEERILQLKHDADERHADNVKRIEELTSRVSVLEEFKPLLESIAENIAFFAEVIRRIGSTLRFFAYLAGFTIVLAGAYEACARLGVI